MAEKNIIIFFRASKIKIVDRGNRLRRKPGREFLRFQDVLDFLEFSARSR
jgi:hypothetical protein